MRYVALLLLVGCKETTTIPDASSDAAAGHPCAAAPNTDGGALVVPAGATCTRYPFPLNGPRDVIQSTSGAIYVTEAAGSSLTRLDDGGPVVIATGFGRPVGVREAQDGSLVVADEGRKGLYRVDPANGSVTPIAENIDFVTYLDVGPDHAFYASNFTVFDSFGGVRRVDVDGGSAMFASGIYDPEGVVFEPDGHVLVAEMRNPDAGGPGRVMRYPSTGGARDQATVAAEGGFDFVFGLALAPSGGFAAAEQSASDPSKDRVRLHTGADARDLVLGIERPTGVTFAKNGDLLVIESVTVNVGQGWLVRVSGW